MAHEIWNEKFAAVRESAWHRLGKVYEGDVLPSQVASDIGLEYDPRVMALTAHDEATNETLETGLFAVVGPEGDIYGTVTERWGYVRLTDLLPDLDSLAGKRPLSAAGALRKGSEIFMTFGGESIKIVGEEYKDYVTVLHSYRPGSAERIIWSPTRVVCANTLELADTSQQKISVAHSKNMRPMIDAALIVANAVEMAAHSKAQLERLASIKVSKAQIQETADFVYRMYVPSKPIDFGIEDHVSAAILGRLNSKYQSDLAYAAKLSATMQERFEVTASTFPKAVRGTAYHLYHSFVEVADHRGGKTENSFESSVVGVRAQEKVRAFKHLSGMVV